MSLNIKYGTSGKNVDITQIVISQCSKNDIIMITRGINEKNMLFSDPAHGENKYIFITMKNSQHVYDYKYNIFIDIKNNIVYDDTNVPLTIHGLFDTSLDYKLRLEIIQNKLKLDYGLFNEELPEQEMVCKYLTGNEKVLEIGGNIGRNSLIIGYILNQQNNNNLVTLETDPDIYKQLVHNRDLNNLDFNIENSALSKRNLIQIGWDTICSDVLLEGYKKINTISYTDLCNKYKIVFNTLVVDCEGAFYYILLDIPEILNNVNLIIIENDYRIYDHKIYMDNILRKNNFYVDYSESGGWGDFYNNFYEVWKR
jgi:FkbM family methyltransferase